MVAAALMTGAAITAGLVTLLADAGDELLFLFPPPIAPITITKSAKQKVVFNFMVFFKSVCKKMFAFIRRLKIEAQP